MPDVFIALLTLPSSINLDSKRLTSYLVFVGLGVNMLESPSVTLQQLTSAVRMFASELSVSSDLRISEGAHFCQMEWLVMEGRLFITLFPPYFH